MKRATMELGRQEYRLTPLLVETFDDGEMSNWVNLNPATKWSVREGALIGQWRPGGSVLWLKPVFEGDVLVSVRAQTLMPTESEWKVYARRYRRERIPEGGKNLNLFILTSGPDGANMLECYPRLLKTGTGPNGMGEDQYNGYFITWTAWWSRFRYLPGYDNKSEWRGDDFLAPRIGKVHHIVALRRGNSVRYFIDGRLVHDFHDEHPHARGQMGFCLWRNSAKLHEFSVYRIDEDRPAGQ